MEIIRPVFFIIFISLAAGYPWQNPYEYNGLVQDQDKQGGDNCPGAECPTMVRPKPSCFAQQAAKVAKEASDAQVEAGAEAALRVQKQLAEKAAIAASAAEAACVGKEQLVDQIELELAEGRKVVEKEKSRVSSKRTYAGDARQAVCQAAEETRGLIALLKKAREGVVHLERVVAGSQHAVAEQKEAVAEARRRLEVLKQQVEAGRADVLGTRDAVERAACAAQEARKRAGQGDSKMCGLSSFRPNFGQTFFHPGWA